MDTFELSILDWIQAHLTSGFGDAVMPWISWLGNGGVLWICMAVILLIIPKTRKTGAAMAVSLALEALCCNLLLKPLVARVRPCDLNTAVQLLIERPEDFSFPSGHTGASFAAAAALFFSKSRLWIPAVILAALIGFSRLYLYVHFPLDVLTGMILGIAAGWLGTKIVNLKGSKKSLS